MTDKKPLIDEIERLWSVVPDHDHHDALYNVKDEMPISFANVHELNEDSWHVMDFHDGKIHVIDFEENGTVIDKDIDVPLDTFSIGVLQKIIAVLKWYENACEMTEESDRAEWGRSVPGDPDAPRPL